MSADELERERQRVAALEYALSQAVHVARWHAGAKVPVAGAVLARASALVELEKRLAKLDELEPVARWAKR